MKVLFINSGASSSTFNTGEKRFPIGLGYLSAMLKQEGHTTLLLDRYADPGRWIDDVCQYDFVGVYTSTPCFGDSLEIIRRLEAEAYKAPIAFGGPHTTAFPETIPPRVDYVVQGEAEYIINDLVNGVYPSGSTIRTPRIKELDLLPRVDYELFLDQDRSYKLDIPFTRHSPIFIMNTARSCPFSCSFCTVKDIWGRLWTAQSAERIVDDIQFLKMKYDIAGVYFREDIFTCDKQRVISLCEQLLENKVGIAWACETRVDVGADEEVMELMARSGCRGIYIGAESGSQKMLDLYKKQVTVDQIVKTCKWAKKYNIVTAMSLITRNPEETLRDRLATEWMVLRARPEIVWRNPYRDEFTRHGTVDFPTYAQRPVHTVVHENQTLTGQKDRLV